MVEDPGCSLPPCAGARSKCHRSISADCLHVSTTVDLLQEAAGGTSQCSPDQSRIRSTQSFAPRRRTFQTCLSCALRCYLSTAEACMNSTRTYWLCICTALKSSACWPLVTQCSSLLYTMSERWGRQCVLPAAIPLTAHNAQAFIAEAPESGPGLLLQAKKKGQQALLQYASKALKLQIEKSFQVKQKVRCPLVHLSICPFFPPFFFLRL